MASTITAAKRSGIFPTVPPEEIYVASDVTFEF
jgi:hypothetical protein